MLGVEVGRRLVNQVDVCGHAEGENNSNTLKFTTGQVLDFLIDEVFGPANFVASVIWEKADSPRNSARQFSTDQDYVLVYSRNINWSPNRLPRTADSDSIYTNPDDDPRSPAQQGTNPITRNIADAL